MLDRQNGNGAIGEIIKEPEQIDVLGLQQEVASLGLGPRPILPTELVFSD